MTIKVDHLCFSTGGGAGIAAGRIVELQKQCGIDAQLIARIDGRIRANNLGSPLVAATALWDFLVVRKRFSDSLVSVTRPMIRGNMKIRPDSIIHTHWTPGVTSLRELERIVSQRHLVVTLHDMWSMTGGCHFAGTCQQFTETCGSCPQVRSVFVGLVRDQFELKKKIYSAASRLTVTSPGEWMLDVAKTSGIFPKDTSFVWIPNPQGFELTKFSTDPSRDGRNEFRVVLSANDLSEPRKQVRKAIRFFIELTNTYQGSKRLELVLIGDNPPRRSGVRNLRALGHISDQARLREELERCDLLISFSRNETFPNSIIEAASVGLPSLLSDIPAHRFARDASFADLFTNEEEARNIAMLLLTEPGLIQQRRDSALSFAKELSSKRIQQSYELVYLS